MTHPLLIIIFTLTFFLQTTPTLAERSNQPNIIIILSDDAGYHDFSMHGNKDFPTPNIDSIAANGVRFTQAYASAAVCSPSRAGLLTGKYQQRFGHEYNLPPRPQKGENPELYGLAESETTLATALKKVGYHTVCLGKWHLGYAQQYHPNKRGFDDFIGLLSGHRSYFPTKKPSHGHMLQHNGKQIEEPPYVTDFLSDQACQYIKQHRDKPLFMYLSYTAVHGPMHAKEQDLKHFPDITPAKRKKLAAMTKSLHDGIGKLIQTLKDEKQYDNTLLIFLNDNGGASNNASSNTPLRGRKGDHFEGGIRVPMLMQHPRIIKKGLVNDHPIISLDIFATAMTLANHPSTNTIDGVNLIPFIKGEAIGTPHKNLFWKRGGIATVREGDWKLIRVKGQPPLLYNLKQDINEKHNLNSKHPDRVQHMLKLIAEWEKDHARPRFTTGPK